MFFAESAGAVAAAAWASGVTGQRVAEAIDQEALAGAPGFGGVREPFKRMLNTLLPSTCAEILNNKNVGVLVCEPSCWWLPFSGNLKVITSFRDKQHVVETVLSSCHVPWVMNWSRVSPQGFIDGSLSNQTHLDRFRAMADRVVNMTTPPPGGLSSIRRLYTLMDKDECLKIYHEGLTANMASAGVVLN